MVKEIKGDILTCGADMICHQTNFHGVMGGGVAWAIRSKLLSDVQYGYYENLCLRHGRKLLGNVQVLYTDTADKKVPVRVMNLFCQDDKMQPDGSITRYDCMAGALCYAENYANENDLTVAVPGYMGCGIAGGNWDRVKKIIHDVFDDSPVELTIVYKET